MSVYILIVFLVGGGATTAEFSTSVACDVARAQITQATSGRVVFAVCAAK